MLSGILLHTKDLRLTSVRNRGELAEGWYDPSTIQKVLDAETISSPSANNPKPGNVSLIPDNNLQDGDPAAESSEDDDPIGPALPKYHNHGQVIIKSSRSGPTVPNMQDLELRNGMLSHVISSRY